MRIIRELKFDEEIASSVERLVEMIEDKVGKSSYHPKYHSFCFALDTTNPNRAKGIFGRIRPDKNGAKVSRCNIAKGWEQCYELTPQNVDELFKIVMSWHEEVEAKYRPKAKQYQSTEGKHVLAGGQVESNRRKF